MGCHTMLWTLNKWVWIGTAVTVAAGPLSTVTIDCIPQGSYCMDTVKPCCQPAVLLNRHIRHYERICFVFGQGLCQPLNSIPYINLYMNLFTKLNGTNYMELRRVYRQMVDDSTEAEFTDSHLLLLKLKTVVTQKLSVPKKG
ncbi:cysteine motif gene-d9.2 [Ichnoviriform fugitivi]|uniref:Cysteine motif gene-d9.2 n=1 Tax=Ichnoviriform fugitivi TaxID=265522 RepID=A2Q0M3_9VIRU|nr:cysteine motif gene-d9.2 [Ichnoviriform fugitivi]BAF45738.1 cysteine motif gene-d9.2 [Ichnoviriform fugitivi]